MDMAMTDKREEKGKTTKGTRGNNSASFSKDGTNGKDFEKWTLEKTNEMLDKLEKWLAPTIVYVKRQEGEEPNIRYYETDEIDYIHFDHRRVFFKDFLLAHGLYASWLNHVGKKYESVSKRINDLKEMQEQLLVRASAMGQIKERTAHFVLMQWYDWRTKTDNENKDITPVVWKEKKEYIVKDK